MAKKPPAEKRIPTVAEAVLAPKRLARVEVDRLAEGPNWRAEGRLRVPELAGYFDVFIRAHKITAEALSVGLRWRPNARAKPIVLLRVNGPHGPHRSPDGSVVDGPHVHGPGPDDWANSPAIGRKYDSWGYAAPGVIGLRLAWFHLRTLANVAASPELDRSVLSVSEPAPVQGILFGEGTSDDDQDDDP